MKLKIARISAGISQKEIAERLNVSNVAVYNWEHGKQEPKFSIVKKMCEIYGVPLDEIEL